MGGGGGWVARLGELFIEAGLERGNTMARETDTLEMKHYTILSIVYTKIRILSALSCIE